ncbi:MAG: DUF2063 domain-containing protein [Shewanella sp.]|nr:DUF2063 domain-containing protein [Shewanella sp.]
MSNLKALQDSFFDYIMRASANEIDAKDHPFISQVAEQSGISAEARLQIYSNGYFARLRSTIETDHDTLAHYLGDELFDKMVQEYVASQPSHFRSLRQFCDALPAFLADTAPFNEHPQIADIATFERRLLNSFDAQDSQRATFEDLQSLPAEYWPQTQLRFHSSVQLFSCHSNAVEVWQAVKAEETPPDVDIDNQRHWLLWRGHTRLTEFISLSPHQFDLIRGFIDGATIAAQCEMMLEYFDEQQAPTEVLGALQAWFSMGLVRSLGETPIIKVL